MGQRFELQCPTCAYTAQVNGGEDAGMIGVTTTITCLDCQKLYDAVTWKAATGLERTPTCPKRKTHRIELWTHPGACPKCGSSMAETGLTALWD
jgi:Zn finger protein HypA/HybF involved in hydrogenase expression